MSLPGSNFMTFSITQYPISRLKVRFFNLSLSVAGFILESMTFAYIILVEQLCTLENPFPQRYRLREIICNLLFQYLIFVLVWLDSVIRCHFFYFRFRWLCIVEAFHLRWQFYWMPTICKWIRWQTLIPGQLSNGMPLNKNLSYTNKMAHKFMQTVLLKVSSELKTSTTLYANDAAPGPMIMQGIPNK